MWLLRWGAVGCLLCCGGVLAGKHCGGHHNIRFCLKSGHVKKNTCLKTITYKQKQNSVHGCMPPPTSQVYIHVCPDWIWRNTRCRSNWSYPNRHVLDGSSEWFPVRNMLPLLRNYLYRVHRTDRQLHHMVQLTTKQLPEAQSAKPMSVWWTTRWTGEDSTQKGQGMDRDSNPGPCCCEAAAKRGEEVKRVDS